MRKTDFCVCKNKGADQLCSDCKADQRLCFCYMGSTNISSTYTQNFKILAFFLESTTLCQTGSETPKTSFLVSRLIPLDSIVSTLSGLILIPPPWTWWLSWSRGRVTVDSSMVLISRASDPTGTKLYVLEQDRTILAGYSKTDYWIISTRWWLCHNMTAKLLTGMLHNNTIKLLSRPISV